MSNINVIDSLSLQNEKRIILVVLDGLGDVAFPTVRGKTALELAECPNLDRLAAKSVCGRIHPVLPGIIPGSGPGHLGLFGYDPLVYDIGRGVLEALGVEMEMVQGDVAARANFATVDENNIVVDRRAGRQATEITTKKCKILEEIGEIDGVKTIIKPGKEHRFVVIFRGDNLSDKIADADPHTNNNPYKEPEALSSDAQRTVDILKQFITKGRELLKDYESGNCFLMRGFSKHPDIPSMRERFKLNSCCIATYPMYRGLASLLGMAIQKPDDAELDSQVALLYELYDDYDFFFFHIKGTDSAGEDGNMAQKVSVIEEFDEYLPEILDLRPDVIAVTGDHSTPCVMKQHSWHPVPLLVYSDRCGTDQAKRFTENACNSGGLGIFEAKHLMTILLSNAGKLDKYGA